MTSLVVIETSVGEFWYDAKIGTPNAIEAECHWRSSRHSLSFGLASEGADRFNVIKRRR